MPQNSDNDTQSSANNILEKLVLSLVVEQRRKRRWGIFFKLITLSIVLLFIWGLFPWDSITLPHTNNVKTNKNQVALIQISGEIGPDADVNAADTIEALNNAIDDKNTHAIILDINSPGGSPVQASYVYNEIRRLQTLHKNIEIDAVCEDLCASAAYYIASGSKNIYANPTSLVGSIGVLLDSFGMVDTLKKVGASRRLYTAGKYKGLLDPFSPITPEAVGFIQGMLDSDHQVFINDVKAGRGNRLTNDPNLFTGLIWSGLQAKQLGLIDGFSSPQDLARERYHTENIVDYSIKKAWFEQLANQLGASFWHQASMKLFHNRIS